MVTIAVDVGFGKVKGFSDKGKMIDFPSVIGDFHPVQFVSGLGNDQIQNLVIGYNHKQYFLGEAALKQSKPQATVDKDRTVSEEGLVLLMGALSLLVGEKVSDSFNMIVGLPVMHYESLKDTYIAAIKKLHIIDNLSLTGELLNRKYLTIAAVKVLPQPMGTFFDNLLNENGEIVNSKLATENVGIIDIGYNTLDFARIDNFDFINPRSTSYSGLGIFSAYQNLSVEIYRNLGIEIPPEQIEAIIRKGEMNISGRQISLEQFKQNAFTETARQIISRVKSFWPDRWSLDKIIISGGGASLLGEFLIQEFQQASIGTNPMFANVSGYKKFGRRVWKS